MADRTTTSRRWQPRLSHRQWSAAVRNQHVARVAGAAVLTADIFRVLDLINASLIAGIIVNLVCVVIHARTYVALGDLVVVIQSPRRPL